MKKGKNILEQIGIQTELPDEVFPGQPLIEIVSDCRVLIEYHQGVCEYGSNQICVAVSYGMIQICGNCLHLQCMTKHQLVISGTIQSITLHRGKIR